MTEHRHGTMVHQHGNGDGSHRHRRWLLGQSVPSAEVYPYYTWAGCASETQPYAVVVVKGPPLPSGYGDMDTVSDHPSLQSAKDRLRWLASAGVAVAGDRRAERIYAREMRQAQGARS
jgi:hypothetical protein